MPSPTILTGLIVGAVLGFILQRGRFCITGAFRDLWVSRSWRWFTAFLLAIAVQAVGVAVLTGTGSITPEIPRLSVVATVVGSFLFGVGIVLAGGCATGTYYRAGEGLVGSWFALVAYATAAAASKTGILSGVTTWVKGLWVTNLTTIPASIGVPDWIGVVILAGVTGVVVHRFVILGRSRPAQVQLPAQRTGLAHLLLEKQWNPLVTGLLVGIVAIIAWPTSWASGRPDGLGITAPSSNLVNLIVTGDPKRLGRTPGPGDPVRFLHRGQGLRGVPRPRAQCPGHSALHHWRHPHGHRRRLGRRLLDRQRPGADLAPVMAGLDRPRLPGPGGRGCLLVPSHPSPAAASRRTRHRPRPRQRLTLTTAHRRRHGNAR